MSDYTHGSYEISNTQKKNYTPMSNLKNGNKEQAVPETGTLSRLENIIELARQNERLQIAEELGNLVASMTATHNSAFVQGLTYAWLAVQLGDETDERED